MPAHRIPAQITYSNQRTPTKQSKQGYEEGELPKIPKIETSPRKTSNGKRVGGSPDRRLLPPPPPPQSSKMVPNSRAAEAGGRDAPMPRNRDPLGGRARVDHAARRSAGDPQCDAGAAQPWPRGAKPREESYGHLPNPRATRHQRRRRPAAGPPFRRARPRPPCSAPLWCARRISSPEALVAPARGPPARRRWWVVRRSGDAGGLWDRGEEQNYLPKCGGGGETRGGCARALYRTPR